MSSHVRYGILHNIKISLALFIFMVTVEIGLKGNFENI